MKPKYFGLWVDWKFNQPEILELSEKKKQKKTWFEKLSIGWSYKDSFEVEIIVEKGSVSFLNSSTFGSYFLIINIFFLKKALKTSNSFFDHQRIFEKFLKLFLRTIFNKFNNLVKILRAFF